MRLLIRTAWEARGHRSECRGQMRVIECKVAAVGCVTLCSVVQILSYLLSAFLSPSVLPFACAIAFTAKFRSIYFPAQETGETVQQTQVLATLEEDPSLIPTIHVGQPTMVPKGISGIHGHLHPCSQTPIHTHMHIDIFL